MTAQTACAVLAGGQLMEGKGSLAPIAMSPRPPKHSKRPGVSNSPRYSRARSSAIHGDSRSADGPVVVTASTWGTRMNAVAATSRAEHDEESADRPAFTTVDQKFQAACQRRMQQFTEDAQAVRARDASMFGADLQSLIQAEQNTSAIRIQSLIRLVGSKKRVQSKREWRAAIVVQTGYRRKMAMRVARNTRAQMRAVLQIQARIRTWRPKAQLRQLKQDATDRRRAEQEARFKEKMKQQYKLEMEERKRQAQAIADAAKKKKGKKSWNGSNACSPRPRGNMKLKDLGRSQSMPVQSSPKAVRRSAEVPASAARRRNHFRRGVNVVMTMNQLLHDKAPGKLDLVNVHSRIDTGRLPTLVPALLLESESESDEAISRSALPVPNTSKSEGGSSASAEYDPWTTFSPRQQAILKEGAQHRGARSSRAGEAVLLAPESSAQLRSWPERARENLGTAPAHGSPASPHLRRFHSLDA